MDLAILKCYKIHSYNTRKVYYSTVLWYDLLSPVRIYERIE
jgi:hypothetical protein